jgi:hypothetical protein
MAKQKIVTKYIVLDESSHEYDMVVTKNNSHTIYELFYSKNEVWSSHTQGTLAFKLIDTGDNYILPENLKVMDYSVSTYLRIILTFEHKTSTNEAEQRPWLIINVDNAIQI